MLNASSHPDRGQAFLADMLTGFVHALEGTGQGQNADGTPAAALNSDTTGVSYNVGAIGWPQGGLPGRGLEIALDPSDAFSFLQTVLFDDVLLNIMPASNEPLVDNISIRVCPDADADGDTAVLAAFHHDRGRLLPLAAGRRADGHHPAQGARLVQGWTRPLLHWGLENGQLTDTYPTTTSLGQPYKVGFTRLEQLPDQRGGCRCGRPSRR